MEKIERSQKISATAKKLVPQFRSLWKTVLRFSKNTWLSNGFRILELEHALVVCEHILVEQSHFRVFPVRSYTNDPSIQNSTLPMYQVHSMIPEKYSIETKQITGPFS